MTTSIERAARRASERHRRALAEELERAMADAGIGIRAVSRAAGVDSGYLSRILAATVHPTLETYNRLAIALGADLSVRLYPNTGPSIRDRHQGRVLEHILDTAHPRFGRFTEVRVGRPARGWIDALLHEPRERLAIATEIESMLRRLEQLVRWHAVKADALSSWDGWSDAIGEAAISRLLVVRRTRATRAVAAEFARQLRAAYPAHPDDALESPWGRLHGPVRRSSGWPWMRPGSAGRRDGDPRR